MFLRITLLCLLLTLMFAACGSPTPEASGEPTRTPFPTFEFVAPTNPPVFNTTPSAQVSATPDTAVIERGMGLYASLECGMCHGENGEGTAEGSSLLELDLSERDFISLMRSGGDIGTSHQYSTNRLSNPGSRALYQYLISLGN